MIEVYTIISGTNRKGSNTRVVAGQYQSLLEEKKITSSVLSLEETDVSYRSADFEKAETSVLIPSKKFIFIAPEYNGSIPGILKTMLDISDYKKAWWGKKALLVGISTGRSGNVRGLEHLTSILNYMKVIVHPNKLPISIVDKLIGVPGRIEDPATLLAMRTQVQEFIEF